MSAPTEMGLLRDTDEGTFECDDCARDFPAELVTETKRISINGKWYYDKQCQRCAKEEADSLAADLEAAQSIKPELEELAAKCESMKRDDMYEALQALSLRMAA